jgi:DNA-binding CsgD family transcriptional regulator
MPNENGTRLGDLSAMVRTSRSLALPSGEDATERRRRMIAMYCMMLGEQALDGAKKGHKTNGNGANSSPVIDAGEPLSRRQRQTLELLLAGNAEKQIAAQLSISKHTVHVYVKSLYKRFGVNSRSELLAKWVKM